MITDEEVTTKGSPQEFPLPKLSSYPPLSISEKLQLSLSGWPEAEASLSEDE